MGPTDPRTALIILSGPHMCPELYELYELRPEGMILVDATCTATSRALPLEAILEERDHVLEYMALPDVSVEPWYHEKPARRSGQKTRPHWPLDKRSARR